LDAASQWKNFGYAVGDYTDTQIQILEAGLIESDGESDVLENRIAPQLRKSNRALVAIDAPLGWPQPLADALANHRAGERITIAKNALFRRRTDLLVARTSGKTPLEIGADRIARAAHAALDALNHLREASGKPIPLIWNKDFSGLGAIEVYPGATLKARNLKYVGYKKPDQLGVRRQIAQELRSDIPMLVKFVRQKADVFDACLCLVAAKDFLDGFAAPPEDPSLAQKEGWIWVRGISGDIRTKSER